MPMQPITVPVAPLQPPNPPPCSEESCTWTAAYLDGAHDSRGYCVRHGPFASACRVCGRGVFWIDLAGQTWCDRCHPRPSLTAQISAVLTDIDGDPDLRTSSPATELRRVLGHAQTAEREIIKAERARPDVEKDIATALRLAAEARAVPREVRQRQSVVQQRADAERIQARVDAAYDREGENRATFNVAGAARDAAARRAAVAVGELARLRAALAEIRAEAADVAQARRLARILGREKWTG